MRILIEKDYAAISRKAALMVAGQILLKPNSVLGLPTGGTPLGMYQELIRMYDRGEVDFSEVVTFNLDEYYQLPPEHEQSYYYFMRHNLFNHINVKPENIHLPKGTCADVEKECADYEESLRKAGGIDLQVLGIGVNGHIGFIEPDQRLSVQTKLVSLTKETIAANSRFFAAPEDVPRYAISMGLGAILNAKRIILLASGKSKASAIKETVNGYVSAQTPSSILQTHADVTIILDQEAASLI